MLMDDRKNILIEKIKLIIVDMIRHTDEDPKGKISDYIIARLHYDYTYLSNLFSDGTGNTIEHYAIYHKIEAVKKLLISSRLTLTQIAAKLKYSSVAHLSGQFKKVAGCTPSFFKKLQHK
jgi:AraC-like DNA-binding protein